ncbi:MAG: hypothetical protein KBE53_12365 [Chromatiaceae bacterium]|nr:hypothetical protein [Chromatiaceae bacterium]
MDRQRLLEHKVRNGLQQLGLLGLLALLLGNLAWVVGGEPFLWGTLMGVAMLWVINPVASPRLLIRLYGAIPLSSREMPGLYRLLDGLAARAGLEQPPRLYYLPSRMMNAFATGGARTRPSSCRMASCGVWSGGSSSASSPTSSPTSPTAISR